MVVGPLQTPDSQQFKTVLAAARANAEWAWRTIYQAQAPRILQYLRLQGAEEPEDVLGETFIQVVRDIDRFTGDEDDFRGWLFRIAHHRLIDAARKRTRRPSQAVDAMEIAERLPAADERESDADGIVPLLRGLPRDQRAVLFMRFVLDLPHDEIATALGKRTGAVKMLQQRGLAAVQQRIDGDYR